MSGTVKYLAYSSKRRMRWLQSTGEFQEFKWNSSTNAWIEGSNRHAGSAMPTDSVLVRSKILVGEQTRVFKVTVVRDTMSDTPKVVVYSTRQTATYTLASGKLDKRCSQFQQGREHYLDLILPETSSIVRRVQLELWGNLQKDRVNQ
jgi:hypothetical protein